MSRGRLSKSISSTAHVQKWCKEKAPGFFMSISIYITINEPFPPVLWLLCVCWGEIECTKEAGGEKETRLAFAQSGWVSVNSWLLIPWPDGKRATRPTRRDCPRVKPEMDTWRVEEGSGGVTESLEREVRKWKAGFGQTACTGRRGEVGKE